MELGILVKRQACPLSTITRARRRRGDRRRESKKRKETEKEGKEKIGFSKRTIFPARDHPSEIEQQGAKSGGGGQRTKSWKESGSTA